jgi:hypothetical protein
LHHSKLLIVDIPCFYSSELPPLQHSIPSTTP